MVDLLPVKYRLAAFLVSYKAQASPGSVDAGFSGLMIVENQAFKPPPST
jgi:hypothetical protein